MGLTLKDLEQPGISKEEYDSRKQWIDQTRANDTWANKSLKPVGILLTSHQGNRAFLKGSVESHAKLGYWITLAYDNYVNPAWSDVDHNKFMPPKDVLDKVDAFFMGKYQTWGGPLYPYFWLIKWGAAMMRDFEIIYCANGDFILEKPEGFPKLLEMMGDADIMTSGPDRDDPPAANTAGFIIKTKALEKIVKHLQDRLVPWANYEKFTKQVGNMEGRLGWAVKELGLKQKKVAPPLEDMFRVPGNGTWAETVGFRHIHAELNYAYRHKKIPPPLRYMDDRFLGSHDLNFLQAYEKTKDVNELKNWWEKD